MTSGNPQSRPTAIVMEPIGYVRTAAVAVPRHWAMSDLEGELEILPPFIEGLRDIAP